MIASYAHEDGVYEAEFSPDATRVLTASADKSAKLWEAASGKLIATFLHEDSVNAAVFSPNGTRILTASADHSAKLWDQASGRLVVSFINEDSVNAAVFSPDGTRVLTASADKTAKLWDTASGKLVASFVHEDSVNHVAFSPDGTRILTASADNTAKLWDAATPIELARQVKESDGHGWRAGSPISRPTTPPLPVETLSGIASGLQFSEDGSVVAVDEKRRLELTKELKDLAQGLRSDARFLRWFFSTEGDRTILPASDVRVVEWIDNALLTNPTVTEDWLRNALVFLPNNSLLHVALARFERDSVHADFLRSFGLARLPKNSVLCTRAGEMLLGQNQPKLALATFDKGLLADPTDVAAQHLRLKILEVMPR